MAFFILCCPFFLGVGLSIALVAIRTGVILSLFISIFSCVRCRNMFNDIYQFINKFTFYLSDRYVNFIERLVCSDVEGYDDINQLCQFAAQVVFNLVIILDSLALIGVPMAISWFDVVKDFVKSFMCQLQQNHPNNQWFQGWSAG